MKILVKCDYAKKMIAQLKDIYSKFSELLLNLFLLYPSSPMGGLYFLAPMWLGEVMWLVWTNAL